MKDRYMAACRRSFYYLYEGTGGDDRISENALKRYLKDIVNFSYKDV